MIKLEMLPAKAGDCLLIVIDGKLFLIDGGYNDTYDAYLNPRLKEYAKNGDSISRIIVSHIDNDHICGIIRFLEDNGNSQNPRIIAVDQIWHNSYRHIQSISEIDFSLTEEAALWLSNFSYLPREQPKEQLIGARSGSSLASLILRGGYRWNDDFANHAIVNNTNVPISIPIDKNIHVILLTPQNAELKALERQWKLELYKLGFREKITNNPIFDDAFEFLLQAEKKRFKLANRSISATCFDIEKLQAELFVEDTSVTNRSSISFILSHREHRLLFLGDSSATLVEQALRSHFDTATLPIVFDCIKVSHHGSKNNTSPELLQIIDSPIYCISTNGDRHNHPDPETIARIIFRPCRFQRNIYFNYRTPSSSLFENSDLQTKYNYRIHYNAYGQQIEIA